ncbi:hypothetical protein SLS58_009959 [Diplodia intermedia]|uniref:Uncharacterized protein n=1 Tax=Diplodia intermedia TaxID=856260 RepID=A0ABR3T982_9PEZI
MELSFSIQEDKTKKDAEETETPTSRGPGGDVSQTINEEGSTANKPETQGDHAEKSQEQDPKPSSNPTHEDQVEEEKTKENSPPQSEVQRGETTDYNHKKISVKDCLRLEPRLQIRECEWIQPSNDFNMDDPESDEYHIVEGQNQYSLVVDHHLSSDMKASWATKTDHEAVRLVIAAFVNGQATKIAKTRDEHYEIQLDSEDVHKFDESQPSETNAPLEITVTYDLRLLAKTDSWESTLVPASSLDLKDLMSQNPYEPGLVLSDSTHLDFIMKPFQYQIGLLKKMKGMKKVPHKRLQKGLKKGSKTHKEETHFAFQFLLKMYSRVPRGSQLAERIFETCKGHLEWIFLHIEKDQSDGGQFHAGYCANGKKIPRLDEDRTSQHTTLQIIKAGDFMSTFDHDLVPNFMDTALFYDDTPFSDDSSQDTETPQRRDRRTRKFLDTWIRTMQAQHRHERADDTYWQEPLQYALAMHMGKRFLARDAKLSDIFVNDINAPRWAARDLYWHTSFELPYSLWLYDQERSEEIDGQDKKQTPPEKPTSASQQKPNTQTQSQWDQRLIPKLVPAKTVLKGQDFVDQRNIFEISDEWLTGCPEFLHFDPHVPFQNLQEIFAGHPASYPEFSASRRLIVDIPKRRGQMDDQTLVDPQPRTDKDLFDRLQQWRTKAGHMLIKKRVIWLSSGDKRAAEMCPVAVPESERPALTAFFGKHNNSDKYFLDDPSATSNAWKTEFQLSFYQLGKDDGVQSKPEIALAKRIRRGSMGFRFNGDFFDCYWTCHVISSDDRARRKRTGEDPTDQETAANEINQDMETLLHKRLSKETGHLAFAVSENGPKKRPWHQRKVLELILFDEIIAEVTTGTQEILQKINDVLASTIESGLRDNEVIHDLPEKVKETIIFSKIDSNAYFSFSSQWEVLQQLLQVLNEDLSDTIEKINSWQNREKNRGKEILRWTRKDEKRYRPALRRMQISNAESVRQGSRLT